MVENWMYQALLSGIRHDYIVVGERVIYYGIDVGSVEEIAKQPKLEMINALVEERRKEYYRKIDEEKQRKMASNAQQDGKTFGEFLLWMNADIANYPGMWSLGMMFAKMMGYNTLDAGVEFVAAIDGVLRDYRAANKNMITARAD